MSEVMDKALEPFCSDGEGEKGRVLKWTGRHSMEQKPHSIKCSAYRGSEKAMRTDSCTCGSLSEYVTALQSRITELERQVPDLTARLQSISCYCEGHEEPGYECALCIIDATAKGEAAPLPEFIK